MAEVKLKGTPIHTNGKLPLKGEKAPEIHGVGADLTEKTLADFKGKKKIICFVPSLDTGVKPSKSFLAQSSSMFL
jgi:thiol peroxidase